MTSQELEELSQLVLEHFAEQAELVQNLTALTGSGLWPRYNRTFLALYLQKILEQTFDLFRECLAPIGLILPTPVMSSTVRFWKVTVLKFVIEHLDCIDARHNFSAQALT